jgi:hypothetical protein
LISAYQTNGQGFLVWSKYHDWAQVSRISAFGAKVVSNQETRKFGVLGKLI